MLQQRGTRGPKHGPWGKMIGILVVISTAVLGLSSTLSTSISNIRSELDLHWRCGPFDSNGSRSDDRLLTDDPANCKGLSLRQ